MSDTGWSHIPITFDNILFYSLFTFYTFFWKIIANTSTSNRISNVYQHFFLFSTSSSPILLIHCFFHNFFFPKPSFLFVFFSVIPFSSHNLFLRWWIFFRMEVFTFFVLGLRKASDSQKLLSPCARTLGRFQITIYWIFFALRRFISSVNRRIACTRLGNPKICFTLHYTRRHFTILGQRNRNLFARDKKALLLAFLFCEHRN